MSVVPWTLQSVCEPLVQVGPVHTPLAHIPGQTLPHMPQFAASERRFTSQPLAGLASQLAKLGLHAMPHIPLVQVACEFMPDGQAFPHALQFLGSLLVL